MIVKIAMLLFVAASALQAVDYGPITVAGVKKEMQRGCTLVHVWAAWCDICVQELPEILRHFDGQKKIYPVVIDISQKLAQEKFSKPWLQKQPQKMQTYFIAGMADGAFMKSIDARWSQSLPYTAFYSFGKKIKEWSGSFPLSEADALIKKRCN